MPQMGVMKMFLSISQSVNLMQAQWPRSTRSKSQQLVETVGSLPLKPLRRLRVTCRSLAIDALIVGVETQGRYLASKKTWTRKIVIVTDGESPIEVEDWEATVQKMDSLHISLTVVYVPDLPIGFSVSPPFSGIDFDDEAFPYIEPNKSNIKVLSIVSICSQLFPHSDSPYRLRTRNFIIL